MSLGIAHLASAFGVVAFGAVVPIVPTGAAVSVAAVLADNVFVLLLVVAVGAAGAYVGDIVTYAGLRLAGDQLSRRVRFLRADASEAALEQVRHQLDTHEVRTLLLSRLVPGGRVPVLLAAAIGGYSIRRYVVADIAAASLWSVVYAAIGLAGHSVFPETWQGIVAAMVLVLVVSLIPQLWQRLRRPRTP